MSGEDSTDGISRRLLRRLLRPARASLSSRTLVCRCWMAFPGSRTSFCASIEPNMLPTQLGDYDVLISLKPKITAQSLEESRACAPSAAAALATTTWIWRPARNTASPSTSRRAEWCGRWRNPSCFSSWRFRTISSCKDRQVRQGLWAESTRRLGREPRQRVVGTIGLGNIASEAIRLLRGV